MSIKAVIDTNVLVSAFLTKNQNSPTYRIADAILNDRFTAVYSHGMLDEYAEVLGRDYLNLPPSQSLTSRRLKFRDDPPRSVAIVLRPTQRSEE